MDFSVIILAVFVLGAVGAIIYLANLDDLARVAPQPAAGKGKMFGSAEVAAQQRATVLRWALYSMITLNFVFALLILQLGLLESVPEAAAEFDQLEVALPEVDQGAAVGNFILALAVGILAFRAVSSDGFRGRIKALIGGHGLYNPDSSVHTTALILALVAVSFTLSQLVISGGLSGLAESVESNGVSLEAELFTAALMTTVAFLGIGLAIRRGGAQSLARLGLRLPTSLDVTWGIGAGAVLFGALIVMGLAWEALVPPEQIAEQNAAAQQIAASFNTLPLAFILSLAAATSEEILFRGALQPIFGLIPTSIFFALLHIQYTLTPATIIIFVVGLGLGWLRQRQSTTAAIIAHFVYNFIQLALVILQPGALGGPN